MQTFSIDGRLCSADEANIPVTDHGFLYGDGVFEGLRFYNGRVLEHEAHLTRLSESAQAIALALPMSIADIMKATNEVIKASGLSDGYVRLIVTRGRGPLGVDPTHCERGRLVLIVDELTMVSSSVREQGAKLIIASTRRLAGDQLDSRIKSLNYLNQIMARLEANAAGADEAVVLNQRGFVAEGTADNIFIVKAGVITTPPVTDGALDGITRRLIIEAARSLSYKVSEHSLTSYDLFTADECFLTGTGAELIPVKEISGRRIGEGNRTVFNQLEQSFRDTIAAL